LKTVVILLSLFLISTSCSPATKPTSETPANSTNSPPAVSEQKVTTITHTFKAGDTLWSLANQYLGNGSRWSEIAELNGIKDETAIPNGTILLIPSTGTKSAKVSTTPTTKAISANTIKASVICSIDFEVRPLIREWNRISAQMLASYMDMSIPIDQVVNDFESLNPKLTKIVREMHSLEECLPSEERKLFTPFLATYNDKISGYSALENSLRIDSPELEQTALEMLTNANNASVSMACKIGDLTGETLPGVGLC
jgi:LysM repeat protein